MDSNHDKVIQSHLCYRYTTRQSLDKLETGKPRPSEAACDEQAENASNWVLQIGPKSTVGYRYLGKFG
ncbi:MAG: hypothetical protein QOH31_5406 [Verrucomicrobiota bacterium]|jgi:hypothetical protein